MATISFKTKDELKNSLYLISKKKGINLSSYIKMVLTERVEQDLKQITPNGLTIAEELHILKSDQQDETYGPFNSVNELMKSLEKPIHED